MSILQYSDILFDREFIKLFIVGRLVEDTKSQKAMKENLNGSLSIIFGPSFFIRFSLVWKLNGGIRDPNQVQLMTNKRLWTR